MAIVSVGYAGQVTEANWPVFAWNLVGSYSVASAAALRVTPTTGDRTVAVADGIAVGAGVMDTASSLASIALPSVSSGSRWDLIALRRNWSTGATTVVRVEGSASKVIPAGREVTPGTIDDQPLALVRVAAGSTVIQEVVDLRVWVADGGAYAADELVLSYLNRLGTHLRIGEVMWFRSVDLSNSPVWRKFSVQEDTGWVEGTRDGGWNTTFFQVRRIGDIGFLRLSAGRTADWSIGSDVGLIPVGFRPTQNHYVLSSWTDGTRGEWIVQTNGRITANQPKNFASGTTLITSYPI